MQLMETETYTALGLIHWWSLHLLAVYRISSITNRDGAPDRLNNAEILIRNSFENKAITTQGNSGENIIVVI